MLRVLGCSGAGQAGWWRIRDDEVSQLETGPSGAPAGDHGAPASAGAVPGGDVVSCHTRMLVYTLRGAVLPTVRRSSTSGAAS